MKYILLTAVMLLFSCNTDVETLTQDTTNSPEYSCLETCGQYQNKTLVCHLPPGNIGNPQTLCVSGASASAHLAHLDYCGQCEYIPECGDSVCEAPEDCSTCEADCGNCPPVCGDGACEGSETCDNCSSDCGPCPPTCNDNVCEYPESCETCACDCGTCDSVCGDGICQLDEDCSLCPEDCGECPTCDPTCGDYVCDEGETCSTCAEDCGDCPPLCGNSFCEPTETCSNCTTDCGDCPPRCGDDVCDTNEACGSCPTDCGECVPTCGDGVCLDNEECGVCVLDCGECPEDTPDAGVMHDAGVVEGDSGTDQGPAVTVVGGELLGCSSGGGKGTLLTVMFLALLFVTVRSRHFLPFLFALTFFTVSGTASAQVVGDPGEFKLERFELGSGYNSMLTIEGAEVGLAESKGMNMFLGYANDPLVVQTNTGSGWNRAGSLIGDQVSGSIGGYYNLVDRLSLGLDVPFILYQGRDAGSLTGLSDVRSGGLGDPKFMAKYQVLGQEKYKFNLSIGSNLTFPLPTTSRDYITEKGLTFVPYVAASKSYTGWRIIGNVGVKLRQSYQVVDLKVGNQLAVKVGAGKDVGEQGELMLTLSGSTSLSNMLTDNSDYSEAMVGYSRDYGSGWSSFMGTGIGLNKGFGSPDWRVFLGMKFDFKSKKNSIPVVVITKPPEEPEPKPEPIPVPEKTTVVKLVLTVPGAFFKFNQSYVPRLYRKRLEKFATELMQASNAHPELDMFTIVAGHTDSLGTQEYNFSLAERRAQAVAKVLHDSGVPLEMIIITNHGETKPIDSNKTVEGRAANRRVEVYIGGDEEALDYYDIVTNSKVEPTGRSTFDKFGNLPNR